MSTPVTMCVCVYILFKYLSNFLFANEIKCLNWGFFSTSQVISISYLKVAIVHGDAGRDTYFINS